MISDTCYDQCYDSIIYWIHIYSTITSTEVLKGWRNVIRKQFKKLKSLLNLIRVTRTEEEISNKGRNLYDKYKQKKLCLSCKSIQKTASNKLMLGWGPGFELTTCDLWFKSQIQSFTNKCFSGD